MCGSPFVGLFGLATLILGYKSPCSQANITLEEPHHVFYTSISSQDLVFAILCR